MAGKKWRRVTLSFDPEHDKAITKLRRELFPFAPESIGLREILLQIASGCGNALQSAAEIHGLRVVPLGEWEAMSKARAIPEGIDLEKKEEEGKKKKKREVRLAPLAISEEVIGYLNEQAGSGQRPSAKSHRRLIQARMDDGATVEDLKTVIRKKCAEWKGTDMAGNLKPSCLFGASNFEGYLGQPEVNGRRSKARTHVERMAEAQEQGEWTWDGVVK